MSKQNWVIAVIVVLIIIAGLWYSGVFGSSSATPDSTAGTQAMADDSSQTAAAANATASASVATQLQQLVTDLTAAQKANNAQAFVGLQTEYQSTVGALATLSASYQTRMNAVQNMGTNVSAAQAALKDMNVKLSALQTGSATLANAKVQIDALNAIFVDMSKINTALTVTKK